MYWWCSISSCIGQAERPVFAFRNFTLIWNLSFFHWYVQVPAVTEHSVLSRLQKLCQKIVEYSKTHRSICGDINLTTREAIIQIHHLEYDQFSSPTVDDMCQYAFQKALIKNTDTVYQSVNQVCFHITKHTCGNCSKLTFIFCVWCWKHMCFKLFYMEKHYHG